MLPQQLDFGADKLNERTVPWVATTTCLWLTTHSILVDIFAGDMNILRIAIAPVHSDGVAIDTRDMCVV